MGERARRSELPHTHNNRCGRSSCAPRRLLGRMKPLSLKPTLLPTVGNNRPPNSCCQLLETVWFHCLCQLREGGVSVNETFIARVTLVADESFQSLVSTPAAVVRPLPAQLQALVERFQPMQWRPPMAMEKVCSAFFIPSPAVVGRQSWSSLHSCRYP